MNNDYELQIRSQEPNLFEKGLPTESEIKRIKELLRPIHMKNTLEWLNGPKEK